MVGDVEMLLGCVFYDDGEGIFKFSFLRWGGVVRWGRLDELWEELWEVVWVVLGWDWDVDIVFGLVDVSCELVVFWCGDFGGEIL